MSGKLRAKISTIEVMMNTTHSDDSNVDSLKKNLANIQVENKHNITDYLNQELQCLNDQSGKGKVCTDYDKSREDVINGLIKEAESFATYQHANLDSSSYLNSLQKQKEKLQSQLQSIEALLGEVTPYLGGLLDATPLEVASLQDTYRDREWMQFEFDSKQFEEQKDSHTTAESVTAQMSFHILFFHGGGSYTHSKQTAYNSDQLAQSNMRVKGEMLRVNIKRPWFKPELFDNPEIDYVSCGTTR